MLVIPRPWRTREFGSDAVGSATATTLRILYSGGPLTLAQAGSAFAAFYLDAAADGWTQCRVDLSVRTNAVAPATTFTATCSPVATWNGASGARPGVATVGAALASTAIASPAASSSNFSRSAGVAAPAAGFYVLTLQLSAANAANSLAEIRVRLQVK